MKTFKRLRDRIADRESFRGEKRTTQRPKIDLMSLPVEIRLQIWEELIGGKLCHMVVTSTYTLKCYPCREFSKDTWGTTEFRRNGLMRKCPGGARDGEACHVSYLKRVPFHTLSLFLTSHSIHSEGLGVLYGQNVFHINQLQTLQAMINGMGPRIRKIKTFHIELNAWQICLKKKDTKYDSAYDSWIKKWELFAREFTGLQNLRLDVWGCAPNRDFWRSDLEPLLKLKGLKSFRFCLWHHKVDIEGQQLPISEPIERYYQERICG
ncbi:MAG: hypothetical protein Q9168_004444 [Polycauliona sp. 1 TL-2023]